MVALLQRLAKALSCSLPKSVYRFRKNNAGNSAVEFAFIAPILFSLVFAAAEFGAILYTYTSAEAVTNAVARQLAANRINREQAIAAVRPNLPTWSRGAAVVTLSASSTEPAKNLYTLTTTLPMRDATPTGLFKAIYRSKSINVSVTMQQEPVS